MEYQVMAQNWMMTNMRAKTFFLHQNAEQSVRTKAKSITTVAITLVLANMLLSCFMGPIRNKVLQQIIQFSTFYSFFISDLPIAIIFPIV